MCIELWSESFTETEHLGKGKGKGNVIPLHSRCGPEGG